MLVAICDEDYEAVDQILDEGFDIDSSVENK